MINAMRPIRPSRQYTIFLLLGILLPATVFAGSLKLKRVSWH